MSPTLPDPASPRRRRTIIAISTAAGVAAIAVVGVLTAQALSAPETAPPAPPQMELIEETPPPGLVLADPEDVETQLRPMDLAVMQWQSDLQSVFAANPNFGSPSISPDGTVFTIVWFGEPSDALRDRIADAPEGLDVVIQPADFPPGELQQLVVRAMQPDFVTGVQLSTGMVENDASGLRFGIADDPDDRTLDDIGRTLADALGRPDVPVRVEVTGAVIPIPG